MLRVFAAQGRPLEAPTDADALWFDLLDPSAAEEKAVETVLGLDVPTPAEQAAFEESARFFVHGDALHLTATLLGRREDGPFVSGPVRFILTGGRLVTIRRINPRAFETGKGRASANLAPVSSGGDAAMALLEGSNERLADILAELTQEATTISTALFAPNSRPDLRRTLRTLGMLTARAALVHESLSSLVRLAAFARTICARFGIDEGRMATFGRDAAELERLAGSIQERVSYLQDAALGLVNADQADALKALTVAAAALAPATLVASIFGMNFEAMAWFSAPWGPWAAFGLMIAASLALIGIARLRGWF